MSSLDFHFTVPGNDFSRAGEASSAIKNKLKQLGIGHQFIRKIAIAMYEGEINLVIHGGGGEIDVHIAPERVDIVLSDKGPGIPDVALAMTEGYSTAGSEARNMGFGAGMGLPNMKKYADSMKIDSTVGEGTTVRMSVNLI